MKVRESNYELLRIVSMLMIVAFHTFRYVDTSGFSPIEMVAYHGVRWYGLFGVNCFLMISAWFLIGRQIQVRRLFAVIWQTAFYCIGLFLCHILYEVIRHDFHLYEDILAPEWEALLSPLWSARYWFITAYVAMYLLVPAMNALIARLTKQNYKRLLLTFSILLFLYQSLPQTVSNTSVTADVIWTVYVYLLTGYLKLHAADNYYKRHACWIFPLVYITFVTSKTLLTYGIHNDYLSAVLSHTLGSSFRYSFMMLFLAVGLFYLFQRIHMKSRLVNTIASCTFGVYLFHENKIFHICQLLATKWYTPFMTQIHILWLFMLTLVIVQYTAGTIIELLRKTFIAPVLDKKLDAHLEPLYQKWDRVLNYPLSTK